MGLLLFYIQMTEGCIKKRLHPSPPTHRPEQEGFGLQPSRGSEPAEPWGREEREARGSHLHFHCSGAVPKTKSMPAWLGL